MKKLRFVKALFAALVLVLALPSCSDFDGAEGTDAVQTQGNKVALKISAGNGYERTALPGEIDLTNDNYAFTLEGTPKGKSLQCYAKDYSYSDLIGAKKIYVEEGEYDSFTLHVSNPNTWILAGTVSNVTISAENNSLKFKLFAEESETETGSVSIEVTVPAEYGVQTVTALLNDETTSSLTISEIADGKATITGSVPAGQSMVKIALLDVDGTEVGSYYDSVYAVAGITSSDSLTVPVLKYKASVNVTTTATTAPTVTLKNNDATLGTADIVLTSTSTESPFAYTKYVPMGTYNVYVGNDPHGSLSNVTQLAVNTNVTLQSISAAWTDGTQPRFYVGATESQILAALTVTGTYKDDDNNTSTQAIASGCTLSGYDSASTATTQTVKVVYSEKESAEITVTLTPVSVASIAITSAPTKTVYKLGESLDLAGLVITPTMNNGTTGDDVAYSDTTASDFAATGFDASSAAANKTVTITYKNIETATATFSVKIIALAGIEITTLPTKTTGYKSTDTELDLTGMVVTATYTDGTTDGLNASGVISTDENATVVTDDVTVSEPDFTQSDEQTVTVTYKEGTGEAAIAKTATFTITVAHEYAQTMTLDLAVPSSATASVWFPWSGISVGGSSAATVAVDSTTVGGYLQQNVRLTTAAKVLFRTDKGALFVDRSSASSDYAPANVITATNIPGKFKIVITYKPTNKTSTSRGMKIYRGTEADSVFSGESVAGTTYAASQDEATLEYEYTGSDETSVVGIQLYNKDEATEMAVYLTKIEIYTDTPIPADSFPATDIAFTNSEIAEGVLSLTKDTLAAAGTTGFALEAQVTPSYATDKTYSFAYTTEAATPHISVSEAGVIIISDADSMTANETGTITVTANGGTNVSATIALTVVAQVDDATKIASTKTELEAAFNGTGSAFEYGSVATAAGSATAFINNLSLSYKDDVTITPTVDESTGKLTLTISIAGSSADSATVEYAYTETLALAAVTAAVAQIKTLTTALVWNTDAATTVSNINTAIGGLTITDATATAAVSATDSDTVVVTVASKIISTVKDETITVSSPFVKVGKYNLTTKAKEGYTVDGSATGAWSSQSAGKTQTHDRMTITSTIDSSGANVKPSSQNSGCITFTLGSPMAMTFTDSNKKGIEIFSADGTVNGKSVSDASYTAGKGSGTLGADGTETTVNLSAGTYFVYGASTGGSAKLATLVFVEIISSPIDITENLPTGDVELKTDTTNANKFIASGEPVTADATIIWYVDDVAQTTGTSQTTVAGDTFTLTGTVGVTYEVRVDVTINGITYSQTESVMYQ